MKKENKNIIIQKITNCLNAKEYIRFTYIFGSFALSNENFLKRSFNDIDIALYILDKFYKDSLSLELKLENELEDFLHIPVDVRIINNAPLSFQYNVISTGRVIIDKDKTFRSDFEGLTLKKYFDFVHLRNEYLKGLANAAV